MNCTVVQYDVDENENEISIINFSVRCSTQRELATSNEQQRSSEYLSYTENSRMQYNTLPLSSSLSKDWWVKDYFEHNIMKSHPSCDKLPLQPYAVTSLFSSYDSFLSKNTLPGLDPV